MALNQNLYSGMTLKALLENPDLQHAPSVLNGGQGPKDKKEGHGSGDIDFTSAFLGPQLWHKTYNTGDFDLEYMDLDEFLAENGIPVEENSSLEKLVSSPAPVITPTTPQQPLPVIQEKPESGDSTLLGIRPSSSQKMPNMVPSPVTIPPDVLNINPNQFLVKMEEKAEEASQKAEKRVTSPISPVSTPPASPLPVQVDFTLTEQDIALSSAPGQSVFDPRARTFTDDELKPQPMIKKSRKVFVPEELKDEKYWARRKKNNFAAKRSRDARRVKENQIAMRAAYLEKENTTLKEELEKSRHENVRLKHRLSKYESLTSSR